MDHETRLKRLGFRSSHRGTREADMMIGGYFNARSHAWGEVEMDWFEALLEEQDVDIMAWAFKAAEVPEQWQGPMMDDLMRLDFVKPL